VNGASGTITIDYATSNGTAIAGQDYAAATNTVTFLNGETSKTIFVPLTNDTQDEAAETFSITLSNPTGGAFLAAPTTHVADTRANRPAARRKDALRFFHDAGPLSLARRYGAHWLLVDRARVGRVRFRLPRVYSGSRYVLYRIP
jgi:hypothetical protein